jgi:hypothetical protein
VVVILRAAYHNTFRIVVARDPRSQATAHSSRKQAKNFAAVVASPVIVSSCGSRGGIGFQNVDSGAARRIANESAHGGVARMRTLMLAIVIAGGLAAGTGCLIPMYSADPARRAQQLIFTSEDLRSFLDEWERIWFLDQPSHMQPLRTHGGII